MEINKEEGVITKISSKNFEHTYKSLKEVISNNPNLNIVAELDHKANAATVDLKINPTKVILFGNPKLGTPLMKNAQIIGLDLPQKMLVWEDDEGIVRVSYNDPKHVTLRYGFNHNEEVLDTIAVALDSISDKATAK